MKVNSEGALVVSDIDTSIYEKKVHLPTSPTSPTSLTVPSSPDTSSRSSPEQKPHTPNGEPPETVKKSDLVMYPYRLPDGSKIYLPNSIRNTILFSD